MHRIDTLKPIWATLLFVALDTLAVGAGMGVPIFAIAFGFLAGWFMARRALLERPDLRAALHRVFGWAAASAAYTLVLMLVIWGPLATMLFNPKADLAQSGVPQILYEPLPSFIGWLVLMILISPFLQLLTTLFAAQLRLMRG